MGYMSLILVSIVKDSTYQLTRSINKKHHGKNVMEQCVMLFVRIKFDFLHKWITKNRLEEIR